MKIRLLLLYLVVVGMAGCAGPSTPVPPPEPPPTPAALEALRSVRVLYTNGSYGDVIRRVATSNELAASSSAVRIEVYKLQAFSYCVSNHAQLCEDAFMRILRIDPAYTLAPNEAGHPTWGPVFRNAQSKAAAVR